MKKKKKKTISCPEVCKASCCQYIVNKIQAPRTKADFDELYWFLCHDNMVVYIERRKWYLLVETPCRHLDQKSRCEIYSKRPYVCRQHSEEECEYHGEVGYDLYMRSHSDLRRYMKKRGLSLRMAWNDPDKQQDSEP